jgi:hypothetical protein
LARKFERAMAERVDLGIHRTIQVRRSTYKKMLEQVQKTYFI